MYIPNHFKQPDVGVMHELIERFPFATLVTIGPNGLNANHLPMLLRKGEHSQGTLCCHVARANPLWQEVARDSQGLAIFQGPNAYITPSWYASKADSGQVVPTWNYVVVHAYGQVRVIDNLQWIKSHIEALTNQQEAGFDRPWMVSDAPGAFIDKLARTIVGLEISITRLEGKWKVSQNREAADRKGVVEALREAGASAMAELVERGTA